MQAAIKSHAKLYFLLDDGELLRIILRTDASDYGYGAYLLQILTDGPEYPVLFLSRSFHNAKLR